MTIKLEDECELVRVCSECRKTKDNPSEIWAGYAINAIEYAVHNASVWDVVQKEKVKN